MFQFASAVGIARKRGYDVSFPFGNCFNPVGGGPIDPKTGIKMEVKCDLLDCFNIPGGYFRTSDFYFIPPERIYSESDFKFNPEVLSLPPNTDLYGYFQDERYFREIREEILRCFKFREEHAQRANEYWEEKIAPFLDGRSPVSLHVRRGDYTLYPGHHPTCSREYYEKAMKDFPEDEFKILVFSDDVEWCKGEFVGDKFFFVETGSPYSDLKIMVDCDHHIIANSSYSWWGAWMNPKEGKRVIAPSRWFGDLLQKDASEIYCPGWRVI